MIGTLVIIGFPARVKAGMTLTILIVHPEPIVATFQSGATASQVQNSVLRRITMCSVGATQTPNSKPE